MLASLEIMVHGIIIIIIIIIIDVSSTLFCFLLSHTPLEAPAA
jgi:hypothetical protein